MREETISDQLVVTGGHCRVTSGQRRTISGQWPVISRLAPIPNPQAPSKLLLSICILL